MGRPRTVEREGHAAPPTIHDYRANEFGWYTGRYYRVCFGGGSAGWKRWKEIKHALQTIGVTWLLRESRGHDAQVLRNWCSNPVAWPCTHSPWYVDIPGELYGLVTNVLRGAGEATNRKDKWYLMLRTYGKPSPQNGRPFAGWWHPEDRV